MYSIVFSPIAVEQLEIAINDFESKQSGLGIKFYEYLNKRIEVLYTYPVLPIVFEQVRVLQIRKYRYRLHFIISSDKKQVKVLALIHAKSNPKKWKCEK